MPLSDCTQSILTHKRHVAFHLHWIISELVLRAYNHDESKFSPEEHDLYEQVVPQFKDVSYGTEEYQAVSRLLGPALQHHHAHNRHHPEYYAQGIAGMTLIDIVEMVCDWSAASQRAGGIGILQSLEINQKHFGIEPQLLAIIKNTLEWLYVSDDNENEKAEEEE